MAGIIDGYRPVLTMAEPQWPFVGLAAAVSLLIFLGGYALLKGTGPIFADLI
jgi:hypothetical protein